MRRLSLLLPVIAVALSLVRPAEAALKLDMLNPTTSGVGAFAGGLSFSPDSDSPTLASSLSGTAFASSSLDAGNSATRLFTLGTTSFGSEAAAFSYNSLASNIFVDFGITGTEGESGPVCLTIDDLLLANNCPVGYVPDSFYALNGITHPIAPGTSSNTFNFNVGDTFSYGVLLSTNAFGASGLLTNELSLKPCPSPSAVPEPCSLALLATGVLPLALKRRRGSIA